MCRFKEPFVVNFCNDTTPGKNINQTAIAEHGIKTLTNRWAHGAGERFDVAVSTLVDYQTALLQERLEFRIRNQYGTFK